MQGSKTFLVCVVLSTTGVDFVSEHRVRGERGKGKWRKEKGERRKEKGAVCD